MFFVSYRWAKLFRGVVVIVAASVRLSRNWAHSKTKAVTSAFNWSLNRLKYVAIGNRNPIEFGFCLQYALCLFHVIPIFERSAHSSLCINLLLRLECALREISDFHKADGSSHAPAKCAGNREISVQTVTPEMQENVPLEMSTNQKENSEWGRVMPYYLYLYVYIYIHMYIFLYIIYIYIELHSCIQFVFFWIYKYIYICVCIYLYLYIYI